MLTDGSSGLQGLVSDKHITIAGKFFSHKDQTPQLIVFTTDQASVRSVIKGVQSSDSDYIIGRDVQ